MSLTMSPTSSKLLVPKLIQYELTAAGKSLFHGEREMYRSASYGVIFYTSLAKCISRMLVQHFGVIFRW
jgi:hypothetical protein